MEQQKQPLRVADDTYSTFTENTSNYPVTAGLETDSSLITATDYRSVGSGFPPCIPHALQTNKV